MGKLWRVGILHNFHILVCCLQSWSTQQKQTWILENSKALQTRSSSKQLLKSVYMRITILLQKLVDFYHTGIKENSPMLSSSPRCWHNADRCLLVEGWKVFGYWGEDRSPRHKKKCPTIENSSTEWKKIDKIEFFTKIIGWKILGWRCIPTLKLKITIFSCTLSVPFWEKGWTERVEQKSFGWF